MDKFNQSQTNHTLNIRYQITVSGSSLPDGHFHFGEILYMPLLVTMTGQLPYMFYKRFYLSSASFLSNSSWSDLLTGIY